jgi:DNA-binding transcriptional MocR family regulator
MFMKLQNQMVFVIERNKAESCNLSSMNSEVDPQALAHAVSGRSITAISFEVMHLIRDGEIAVGQKLPTVRSLAKAMQVSPATISASWKMLRSRGLVSGTGRSGVLVISNELTPGPRRYETRLQSPANVVLDLGVSTPDPLLLPDIYEAVSNSNIPENVNSYVRETITEELREAARTTWPYVPDALLATNGGYDAIRLILYTVVEPGDWVLVEECSPPRILDLLDVVGARPLFVARDSDGIRPEALTEGLVKRPAALILQAGLHNPCGLAMTAARRDELVKILEDAPTVVIEDDGSEALWGNRVTSISEKYSGQHFYVRSYSKSHGPELRIGVVEGHLRDIENVLAFFGYGAGWTSRVLQNALASMLLSHNCQEKIAAARQTYNSRREQLRQALAAKGVLAPPGAGLSLRLPVRDETYAQGVMEGNGIAVTAGQKFAKIDQKEQWIRVSTGNLRSNDIERVSAALSWAVR